MSHRLLNACAAVALIMGGWGGALASAVCRHAGDAAHAPARACCRARTKSQARRAAHSSTHSSTHSSSAASSHSAKHAAPRGAAGPGGHCHAQSAPAAGGSEAQAGGESRAVARAAAWSVAGFARPSAPCGHCVSRSGTPPAAPKVRDREGPRRADESPAAALRLAPAAFGLARDTVAAPARAAPPGPPRLYVLINCFLI